MRDEGRRRKRNLPEFQWLWNIDKDKESMYESNNQWLEAERIKRRKRKKIKNLQGREREKEKQTDRQTDRKKNEK